VEVTPTRCEKYISSWGFAEDLLEKIYMEIPLDFDTTKTVGKVCRLKKSL
jgi:hypothetical protein